jgi:hypothetical protein
MTTADERAKHVMTTRDYHGNDFWDRYLVDKNTGCWEWTGMLGTNGYGIATDAIGSCGMNISSDVHHGSGATSPASVAGRWGSDDG